MHNRCNRIVVAHSTLEREEKQIHFRYRAPVEKNAHSQIGGDKVCTTIFRLQQNHCEIHKKYKFKLDLLKIKKNLTNYFGISKLFFGFVKILSVFSRRNKIKAKLS